MSKSANLFAVIMAVALAGCSLLSTSCKLPAHAMNRVELLFGAKAQDGTPIDDRQWQDFLDSEVTARFPAGLTAYSAYGQWQRPDGSVEKSPSRVLVIWYEAKADASARIDAVRQAYKKRFAQLSVMRVDSADCVSF